MQSGIAIYRRTVWLRWRPPLVAALCCALLAASAGVRPVVAQDGVASPRAAAVPGFWDPRRRPERPDLSRIQSIRFLTEMDYPPFDYAGADGNPAGFNVDLARLLCDEIKTTCTIQARRFDLLLDALDDKQGDAVIASIAVNADTRRRADFTDPYYRTPARFVARADSPIGDVRPELVEGKKIAVVAGTAHEAFLKQMFTEAEVRPYANAEAAREALRNKEVDLSVRRRHRAGVLAQRQRFGRLLRFPRRPVSGKPLFRRRGRHRGQARQRSVAPGAQLGAVPAVGEGRLHRPVVALFSDQSVLTMR